MKNHVVMPAGRQKIFGNWGECSIFAPTSAIQNLMYSLHQDPRFEGVVDYGGPNISHIGYELHILMLDT